MSRSYQCDGHGCALGKTMRGGEMSGPNWQGYRAEVARRLGMGGFNADVAEALLDLDAEMFRLMRSTVKGELPAQLMAELGTSLEAAQFQAVTAVLRINAGIGRPEPAEATIGLLAEEMNVDPSRASRLATDLIAAGYLRRGVSQSDGRKSVLYTTDSATALLLAFRDLKWAKTMQIFKDWPSDDITRFSELFLRYNEAMRRAYPGKS